MSAIADLVLGVVTSIGGFIEAGSISTAAQAGSEFGFQLLWAVGLATLMLAMLVEMSGRLSATSKQSLAAAVRERFGIHFQTIPLLAEGAIDLLLLAAEIGGVAIAVQLLTGIGFRWFVVPVGLGVWLVLWFCGFSVIEYGLGLLGLVTLSFVAAAWQLGPESRELLPALVPSLPSHDYVRYAFLSVSIVGATVSPYLLNFYSSGSVEEQMTEKELWVNRTTAYAGMCFGGVVSMAALVTSALVLKPAGIQVDSYEQASLMFLPAFEQWAVALFAASLGIGCFGAAVEISLNAGYVSAQVLGWAWGANRARTDAARFTTAYTFIIAAALAVAISGVDPLRLTLISVAFTVVVMPMVILPFLVLMNDQKYVRTHTSGPIGNVLLGGLTILGALLALVVIPLEILGGS